MVFDVLYMPKIRIFENPCQDMVHIDNISLVLVSPLQRAYQTYEQLLIGGCRACDVINRVKTPGGTDSDGHDPQQGGEKPLFLRTQARKCDLLMEWDYGDYEGVTTKEILKTRPDWSLFLHGVPNGETVDQVSERCDEVISFIHNYQRGVGYDGKPTRKLVMPAAFCRLAAGPKAEAAHKTQQSMDDDLPLEDLGECEVEIPEDETKRDVLIVAHSHLLRVLAARWTRLPGVMGQNFVLDTASISVLGYEHNKEERVVKVWNQTNHLWRDRKRIG
ncbi:phosphoglycerate mutase 2 [Actinomortierella wolfii]|nr:phosphoglycerate mutase 2 [Actinomortierella wolfii]